MKTICLLIILFSFATQANELVSHKLYQKSLSIDLPSSVKPLSQKQINKRYSKQNNPPNFAFSDKNQTVSFTFTQYPTPASTQRMKKIHKSISNMLRKTLGKAKWKKDKTYRRYNTEIAVFEYETKGLGKYQYNITYALPLNEKLTFISFNTTEPKYKTKWVDLARESLNSIQIANAITEN